MSDENSSTPEPPASPPAEAAPRVRRISTPRPKKVAKKVVPSDESAEPAPVVAAAPAPAAAPVVEASSGGDQDWPEPEAASSGSSSPSEGAKRKRRRRKGKGQGQGHASAAPSAPSGEAPLPTPPAAVIEEDAQAAPSAPRPPQAPVPQMQVKPQGPPQAPQRPRVDPETLTKMAWKIYLAEISEEGVALIGDNDAKELSRRCFRLAEIFIEEQSRRR